MKKSTRIAMLLGGIAMILVLISQLGMMTRRVGPENVVLTIAAATMLVV